jgi:hypothetical protein
MNEIVFEYKGRKHYGHLVSSTNLEPHYHWIYFTDEEITRLIHDDCVGFKGTGKALQPTKTFTTYRDLIDTLKKAVEEHIN